MQEPQRVPRQCSESERMFDNLAPHQSSLILAKAACLSFSAAGDFASNLVDVEDIAASLGPSSVYLS